MLIKKLLVKKLECIRIMWFNEGAEWSIVNILPNWIAQSCQLLIIYPHFVLMVVAPEVFCRAADGGPKAARQLYERGSFLLYLVAAFEGGRKSGHHTSVCALGLPSTPLFNWNFETPLSDWVTSERQFGLHVHTQSIEQGRKERGKVLSSRHF